MAYLKGVSGQIAMSATASVIANITRWELRFSSDKEETTGFGGDNWHTFTQTMQGATGRMSGYSDPAATGQANIKEMFCSGASVVAFILMLTETTGHVFTCSSVLIDDWGIGIDAPRLQTFDASFTVNARPAHA